MFLDYAKIVVKAGKGGDGVVAFRREKFVPKGGPSGGDGGKGGDVIFIADSNFSTLLDFRYRKEYVAEDGAPGASSMKDGKNGEDIILKVPIGTLIKDEATGEVLADLDENHRTIVLVHGGRGGKGNSKFATSTNQTPRFAQDGKPGEEKTISLELKLLADVGLVGFPNAGKSTFISTVSAAKPKIADYPFTTLEPNLGIVRYKEYDSFVIADIPGIIEGAHEGKGLGLKFLKHIERTGILLLMIDSLEEDPQSVYDTLMKELNNYSELLSDKRKIVVFTKIDALVPEKIDELRDLKLTGYDGEKFLISSIAKMGVNDLVDHIWKLL
ncbi:MAG: GTPase ObgE [Melioribacteraceae bacterium]|nr:GTPase ObgE [Melioribacteraceae bacterium]MCF8263877.1 GTPase ObgE [Melioribacteraceae bacterium]MCF8412397.1 GTPase ObgE [Melioribacteraceae bacterium]